MINLPPKIDSTVDLKGLVTLNSLNRARDKMRRLTRKWIKDVEKPAIANSVADAIATSEYTLKCLPIVEENLVELAQSFSSLQWLWYLRRVPEYVFSSKIAGTNHFDVWITEYLSSFAGSDAPLYEKDDHPVFPIDQRIVDTILELCVGTRYFSEFFLTLRFASKGVNFRVKGLHRPFPILSSTTQSAIDIFDQRRLSKDNEGWDIGFTGTYIGVKNLTENTLLGTSGAKRAEPRQNLWNLAVDRRDKFSVIHRYIPRPIPVDKLVAFINQTAPTNQIWLTEEIGALIWIISLNLTLTHANDDCRLNAAWYGYLVFWESALRDELENHFSESLDRCQKLLPNVGYPATVNQMFNILAQPSIVGTVFIAPVLRRAGDWVAVDMKTATETLHQKLRFPQIDGQPAVLRGANFENSVQEIINRSEWNPDADLRDLRGRHLRYMSEGIETTLTDIDAIGQLEDTLLIVSCKSILTSASYENYDYKGIRNTTGRIDKAIEHWMHVKATLVNIPLGLNYNFTQYKRIIAIVCTPTILYTENPNALEYEDKLLRRVSSIDELNIWLISHSNST